VKLRRGTNIIILFIIDPLNGKPYQVIMKHSKKNASCYVAIGFELIAVQLNKIELQYPYLMWQS
jgi:hypothetical protein